MKPLHILIGLFCLPGILLAAGGGDGTGETDIVQRTVNFFIFAGIIYYLVADVVKRFFTGRTQSIADDLDKVQERLRESKRVKDQAEAKVMQAKKTAEEVIATAKKEAVILSDKIKDDSEREIENMARLQQENMELEKRKAEREVAEEALEELFEDSAMNISEDSLSQIILKKVA